MKIATLLAVLGLSAPLAYGQLAAGGMPSGVVASGFVGDPLPTPSCHASTIVESDKSLVAAWFGGSEEGARDVVIWLSRNDGSGWSRPQEVANGVHDEVRIQYPCWNPVLFKMRNGVLLLFYKEGSSPSTWWGMMKTSSDNGATWSRAKKLPTGFFGPVRAKPIELADGTLFCGSSSETDGWRVRIETTKKPL